jgi:hypothetical protein
MIRSETTYRRFEAIEAQIAHCYFLFHERFIRNPRFSQFWLEMAMQELQHSAMVQFCREHACMGDADVNVNASRNIEQLLDVIKGVATDPDVSMDEALHTSLLIESSELEDVYEKLTDAVKDHNELLYRAMHKDFQAHQRPSPRRRRNLRAGQRSHGPSGFCGRTNVEWLVDR